MKKIFFKSLKDLIRFRTILLRSKFRDFPENHDKMKNYKDTRIWRPHQSLPKGNK
jgi:hypothetical protein